MPQTNAFMNTRFCRASRTKNSRIASAEGASEENLESRQYNLVEKFQNCCKITVFQRLCQSRGLTNGCFFPRFPSTINYLNFASAEGASEENLESRQQNLIQKLQNGGTITCIARLRRSLRLTNGEFLPLKARAKKIWNPDSRT